MIHAAILSTEGEELAVLTCPECGTDTVLREPFDGLGVAGTACFRCGGMGAITIDEDGHTFHNPPTGEAVFVEAHRDVWRRRYRACPAVRVFVQGSKR